jgi:hypothetical protein
VKGQTFSKIAEDKLRCVAALRKNINSENQGGESVGVDVSANHIARLVITLFPGVNLNDVVFTTDQLIIIEIFRSQIYSW